jgi:hypothetical protein
MDLFTYHNSPLGPLLLTSKCATEIWKVDPVTVQLDHYDGGHAGLHVREEEEPMPIA